MKPFFSAPLTVTKTEGGSWHVEKSFGFRSDKYLIDVPEGFETDFASVPRGLWNICPPDGKYSQAAVVHDFLYSKRGIVGLYKLTRKECDIIFLQGMKLLGVPFWKRQAMYRAVRAFGWLPW